MTQDSRSSATRSSRSASRRAPTPGRRRLAVAGIAATAAVGVGLAAAWAFGALGADGGSATSCPDGRRVLSVAAAPEIATVLAAATNASGGVLGDDAECVDVQVAATVPADVAKSLRDGDDGAAELPDVWVPDSSLWLARSVPDGEATLAEGVSIARSPLVLAVTRTLAQGLGWPQTPPDLVATISANAAGLRFGLPAPARSAGASGAVLVLGQHAPQGPEGQRRLAAAFRAADRSLPEVPEELLKALDDAGPLAVPVPEQAVWARTRAADATPLVASYPAGSPTFDYPLVVLSQDEAKRSDAALLQEALTGTGWTQQAQAAGFRAADGSAGTALAEQDGVDPALARQAQPFDVLSVQEAVRAFDVISLGTRMLAVIDVSGSMAAAVPEAPGRTRMDLALGAASNGLGLYSDDAQIGLWVFSTDLTPASDHRELVPIGPLGIQPDGIRGREKLAEALAGVTYVPHGDTALYDTALDAVRAVRSGWDAGSVNSVVLLTDGRNDDDVSISLDQLVTTLQQEAGDRGVPVIGIAFGPESDVQALREISRVTGGTTYEVRDPRKIHEVLADALAQRPCRPNC
jgi:Ca-activated chloride channel homolog